MITPELIEYSSKIIELYKRSGLMLATAESCTGGLIAGALTEIAGSSSVVERGFITYSNEAKNELIGVDMALIIKRGAVSRDVAEAMAVGALARSRADAAVSVTGIAGPGGGTMEKPVGLVFIGGVRKECDPIVQKHIFKGSRSDVRHATVLAALKMFEILAA